MPRGSQDRRRRLSDVHRVGPKKGRASSSHIGFLERMMINLNLVENVPMLNYPFPNNAYNCDIQPWDSTPSTLPVFRVEFA